MGVVRASLSANSLIGLSAMTDTWKLQGCVGPCHGGKHHAPMSRSRTTTSGRQDVEHPFLRKKAYRDNHRLLPPRRASLDAYLASCLSSLRAR